MIIINDVILNKKMRVVIGPEFMFYKNHNLLIYFKSVMIK